MKPLAEEIKDVALKAVEIKAYIKRIL